jgi:UDP-N-acetylmuramate dehydrogenase
VEETFPDIAQGDLETVFGVLQRSHEYYRTHLTFDRWSGDLRQKLERGLMELYQLTADGEVVARSAEEAAWGYRRSAMSDDGSIVLSVDLKLNPGDPELIRERMADLAQKRQDKQPLDLPSAGSTFKRPEGHFAGKLIQDAGMQGYRVGGAQVSTKHAGFVVNTGGASASDVMQVICDVQAAVLEQYGVTLEPEVRRWGFDL